MRDRDDVEYWMARCHHAENIVRRVRAFRADKLTPAIAELATMGEATQARALAAVAEDLATALRPDDSVTPIGKVEFVG